MSSNRSSCRFALLVGFAMTMTSWTTHAQADQLRATPPSTNCSTLPVAYWGATSAARPQENLEMLAKMNYIIIEKWEGHCWNDCLLNQSHGLDCSPQCHEEKLQLDTLSKVRSLNPEVSLVFYLNAMLDFHFLELHRHFADADLLLKNTDGTPCVLINDDNMSVSAFDMSQPAARALWLAVVKNLTATGFVDGIYADQAQVLATKNDHGDWGLCKKKFNTCCTMTAATAAAYNSGHDTLLQQVGDLLGNAAILGANAQAAYVTDGVVFSDKFAKDPVLLQRTIQGVLKNKSYVHVVENLATGDQKGDHDPADISSICHHDLLVSFLLAMEKGAFLGCNGCAELT